MFEEGNNVVIIDPGKTYPSYAQMATLLSATKWEAEYLPKKGDKGKIMKILDGYHLVDIGDREVIMGPRGMIKEESMPKFKVGDRAKQIKWVTEKSPYLTVTKVTDYGVYHTHDSGEEGCCNEEDLVLIKEATMSKYQELKERIKNLQNGWDKEADDILMEINSNYILATLNFGDGSGRIICARNEGIWQAVDFYKRVKDEFKMSYQQHSSCDKFRVFKLALLWLLDHSDIKKDEKEEKIKELENRIKGEFEVIKEMQKQIEELRR